MLHVVPILMSECLEQYISPLRERVDSLLDSWTLTENSAAPRVTEAMRYSLFNGGKRIRPILTYAAAQSVSEINTLTDTGAAAVECIHAYSLIHDDLPAMDNDNLRRGKPTCHIAFDEATAILAGDGLQTLAFEKLALAECKDPAAVLTIIRILALASGDKGMVAGQMIDLEAEGESKNLSLSDLEHIHRHKTGALIRAAVLLGAHSVSATQPQITALEKYAEAIGLAFQVQDDILDVVTDTATLGKQQGADISRDKTTYVSLLGLDQARQKAQELHRQAIASLNTFDKSADPLRWIADYIVNRKY